MAQKNAGKRRGVKTSTRVDRSEFWAGGRFVMLEKAVKRERGSDFCPYRTNGVIKASSNVEKLAKGKGCLGKGDACWRESRPHLISYPSIPHSMVPDRHKLVGNITRTIAKIFV